MAADENWTSLRLNARQEDAIALTRGQHLGDRGGDGDGGEVAVAAQRLCDIERGAAAVDQQGFAILDLAGDRLGDALLGAHVGRHAPLQRLVVAALWPQHIAVLLHHDALGGQRADIPPDGLG